MTNKDIKIDINNRFKDVFKQCETLGLIVSRKNAAAILGLSPQMLSEILNGRINVGTEILHKFCSYFEVRIEYIFFGVMPVFIEHLEKQKKGIFDPDKSAKLLKVHFSKDFFSDDMVSPKVLSEASELKENLPPFFYLPNTFGVEIDAHAFMMSEPHMEPMIEQNMMVIATKLNNKSNIINGQVYVIDSRKYGHITRRVFWQDKEKQLLECVPENPEYEAKGISLKEIDGIYRVLTIVGYDLSKRSSVLKKHHLKAILSH
jgi:transcriptional regulator with XRE-family HTH domain